MAVAETVLALVLKHVQQGWNTPLSEPEKRQILKRPPKIFSMFFALGLFFGGLGHLIGHPCQKSACSLVLWGSCRNAADY